MRFKVWLLKACRTGRRPREDASRFIGLAPNQRWATDIALVHDGVGGWCVFVPVNACFTREVLGLEIDLTARAETDERALKSALIARFG